MQSKRHVPSDVYHSGDEARTAPDEPKPTASPLRPPPLPLHAADAVISNIFMQSRVFDASVGSLLAASRAEAAEIRSRVQFDCCGAAVARLQQYFTNLLRKCEDERNGGLIPPNLTLSLYRTRSANSCRIISFVYLAIMYNDSSVCAALLRECDSLRAEVRSCREEVRQQRLSARREHETMQVQIASLTHQLAVAKVLL